MLYVELVSVLFECVNKNYNTGNNIRNNRPDYITTTILLILIIIIIIIKTTIIIIKVMSNNS